MIGRKKHPSPVCAIFLAAKKLQENRVFLLAGRFQTDLIRQVARLQEPTKQN
jgi:hypothetical protein